MLQTQRLHTTTQRYTTMSVPHCLCRCKTQIERQHHAGGFPPTIGVRSNCWRLYAQTEVVGLGHHSSPLIFAATIIPTTSSFHLTAAYFNCIHNISASSTGYSSANSAVWEHSDWLVCIVPPSLGCVMHTQKRWSWQLHLLSRQFVGQSDTLLRLYSHAFQFWVLSTVICFILSIPSTNCKFW